MGFAKIRLLDTPFSVDREYTYEVPTELVSEIVCGRLVSVPFGRASRVVGGVVTGLCDACDFKQVKPILSVYPELYTLSPAMLALAEYMAESVLCTLGEAVKTILPPKATVNHLQAKDERTVLPCVSKEQIEAILGGTIPLRSEAHRRILTHFGDFPNEISQKELCLRLSVTAAQIKALVDRKLLAYASAEVLRNPYAHLGDTPCRTPIHLSTAQMRAYDTLSSLKESGAAKCALLFGVTGSGKTKVMMKMIDDVLDKGEQVIMLVPEIALTPQTVSIFCTRYGKRVAVIHSSLSDGERFDAWRRIKQGDVDLVIGTRSAIFAPLDRLGFIIIDEEHEHTYKSESNPKYHTKDIAAFRVGQTNGLLILASATPSFESFYKAKEGRYTLVPIRERYGSARLPDTEVVDMRLELRAGNTSPYSRRLTQLLEDTAEQKEQSILFLNRRGYNASLQCKNCGEVLTCPHCSVSLTYHVAGGARLCCHLCGYKAPLPRTCPSCQSEHLSYVGTGTQKAEAELSIDFPKLRVMRMDADTTGGKLAYDRMLESFRAGEADVLLGTQMVTKGHDFPAVTLVGVLLADLSLYVSDFRAAERTFSLLTQVIGRAGRAQRPGTAVIQTFAPQNDVIRFACAQDYEGFYASEIELRKSTLFPPFCDIASLTLVSEDEKALFECAQAVQKKIADLSKNEFKDQPLILFGPFEARIYKAAEKFRMQMMIKCKLNRRTRTMFRELLLSFACEKKVTISVDFNPLTM